MKIGSGALDDDLEAISRFSGVLAWTFWGFFGPIIRVSDAVEAPIEVGLDRLLEDSPRLPIAGWLRLDEIG